MVRYASAMSRHAPCEPGGRVSMMVQMVAKVPQVHGKVSESSMWLMDRMFGLFLGKDKFCTRRNLFGFPGLGTMERGEV